MLDTRTLERLEKRIIPEPNSGCWLWVGGCSNGYATAVIGGRHSRVHRALYEHYVSEIPDGLMLDHLCRVRCCVNPAHLEPVTNIVNVRRGLAGEGNRQKTHCPKGHPYSEENVQLRKGPHGGLKRRCATCHREEYTRISEREAAQTE